MRHVARRSDGSPTLPSQTTNPVAQIPPSPAPRPLKFDAFPSYHLWHGHCTSPGMSRPTLQTAVIRSEAVA
ncbi:hypothetical protein PAGU2638_29080 [Lysobacter sp. PAGU 2638]